MPVKLKLSDAVDGYLRDRGAEGTAAGTLRNHRLTLSRLQRVCGRDIYVSSIDHHHISGFFADAMQTRSAGLPIDHSCLKVFFEWCVRNRYVGRFENPMDGRRRPKTQTPEERRHLPASKFPALLDAAERHDPRDRMLNALGLYLFLRSSELRNIRIRDVDLDSGYVRVRIFKTNQVDKMPICRELDQELRKWLTTYVGLLGAPLEPDMFLIPGYQPLGRRREDGSSDLTYVMGVLPRTPVRDVMLYAQRALQDVGFDVRDSDGTSRREGGHTLRRSGARALYDSLVSDGYDGALRRVQAMLHHADGKMTEHYLGITLDRHQRDELIRGVEMFPRQGVVALRSASA